MPTPNIDFYNHLSPAPGTTLPCIALSNSPSTTVGIGPLAVGGTGGAGAGSTASYPGGTGTGVSAVDTVGFKPNDTRGSFIITAAGTPVAGLIAQVNFANPYSQPVTPGVTAVDTTASPNVPINVGVVVTTSAPGATTGFQIATTPALTAGHSYLITYDVTP